MSNPRPVEGFVFVYVYNIMKTCPNFNNSKCNVFDAVALSATVSRLHCVLVNFHVFPEVKNHF